MNKFTKAILQADTFMHSAILYGLVINIMGRNI